MDDDLRELQQSPVGPFDHAAYCPVCVKDRVGRWYMTDKLTWRCATCGTYSQPNVSRKVPTS